MTWRRRPKRLRTFPGTEIHRQKPYYQLTTTFSWLHTTWFAFVGYVQGAVCLCCCPGTIRAAVATVALATVTDVWSERENTQKHYVPGWSRSSPSWTSAICWAQVTNTCSCDVQCRTAFSSHFGLSAWEKSRAVFMFTLYSCLGFTCYRIWAFNSHLRTFIYRGADKSLARPGRKKKLGSMSGMRGISKHRDARCHRVPPARQGAEGKFTPFWQKR